MYVNTCTKCGQEFETKNPKRIVCPSCLYPDRVGGADGDSGGGYRSGPPPQQQGYGPPQQQGGYGPPRQQGYGPPQQQGGYGPPRQQGYGPPQQQGGYGPPRQQGYGPPRQQGYGPPQQQGGYGPPRQQGYGPPQQQGGYGPPRQQGYGPPRQQGYGPPRQGGFGPPRGGGFGPPRGGGFGPPRGGPRRPGGPMQRKKLLVSKEMLFEIEKRYKTALPLPNPDVHEVIAKELELEPSKVFFGINLVRMKMKLPKLEYPKRKLAVTPDQLQAVELLYEPYLPTPPIGIHKIISKQLRMDEWRVHVAIGLIRKTKEMPRWNEDREDLPESMKLQLKEKKELEASEEALTAEKPPTPAKPKAKAKKEAPSTVSLGDEEYDVMDDEEEDDFTPEPTPPKAKAKAKKEKVVSSDSSD
ncbi:MAG: hypothetical protein K2X66_08565 [Cyanobacteria bacterium]|nr:hypothetical protein [Cyanobacteriota bacterium]